jgi:hypothetical protein
VFHKKAQRDCRNGWRAGPLFLQDHQLIEKIVHLNRKHAASVPRPLNDVALGCGRADGHLGINV